MEGEVYLECRNKQTSKTIGLQLGRQRDVGRARLGTWLRSSREDSDARARGLLVIWSMWGALESFQKCFQILKSAEVSEEAVQVGGPGKQLSRRLARKKEGAGALGPSDWTSRDIKDIGWTWSRLGPSSAHGGRGW